MRRRLILSIAGVATTAVLLLAVPLGLVLASNYRNDELLRLQRDTFAATRQIDLGATRADPVELPATTDTLIAYDPAGRRVAGRGPQSAPAVVAEVLRTGRPADRSGDGRLTVAVPLTTDERTTGAVLAERSDAAAVRDARGAWLVLAGVAGAIIALATLAAVLLGRSGAAPLERLAVAARRLGDGDFSVRAARAGIDEIDALGIALNTTAQRLDELVTRERAFSADASHQLRTPLQALRIELEAVQLRGEAPAEVPAALAQVDRLQATIDTLLAVARDAPRSATTTDLGSVLDELADRWRGPLAAAGRPLRTVIEPAGAAVQASAAVTREILDILLANATDHGRGAVTLVVRATGVFVVTDVHDEGEGFAIDPDAAFERRTGDGDGHGIGLTLARSLAHAEGGRLLITRAESSPVISLVLPAPPAA